MVDKEEVEEEKEAEKVVVECLQRICCTATSLRLKLKNT